VKAPSRRCQGAPLQDIWTDIKAEQADGSASQLGDARVPVAAVDPRRIEAFDRAAVAPLAAEEAASGDVLRYDRGTEACGQRVATSP
jgi:hypothetical protein